MDVPASVRHHYSATSICLSRSLIDGLTQILLTNICGVPIRPEERGVNRSDVLYTCLVCACFFGIFSLVKINRGIVVNVDVVTGIIIPIEVEIINYIVHGKIKNSGGHKKHRPLEQETGQQLFSVTMSP